MLQFLGPMNSRLLKQNFSSSFNLNHSCSRKNNFWMKSTLSEKNPISPYTPFIGPNALIRSSGRIKLLVEADYDIKHPIILDSRHPAVRLFLKKEHLVNHHEGKDFLRACIQRRYAVLKLRSALRSVKFNCVLCRKRSKKSVQPMMADLPAERLSYGSPPFFNTGMAYFGPFYVSV